MLRPVVKRIADVGTIVALSIVGILLLPALLIMTINSFEPPFGHEESPLMGAFFALTFAVVAAILVRTWASLRRG